MGLLAPIALAALPLLGIVLALYLLKLRRPQAPVASLHLWESLTRDREANSLWQRLRVSPLMVLQLLVLLVLILTLARPWVPSSEPVGRQSIIVVDTSASMSATDGEQRGERTRIDLARERARQIVDTMPQGGTATLISTNTHAEVLVPATADKSRLRAAIDNLVSQPAGTDITEAMKLVRALAARQANSAVYILSDGDFKPLADEEPIKAEINFEVFGRGPANQGITALSLQQQPGNLQLFAQVVNSDAVTVTRRLDFEVDDSPWTARTLTLAPGATQEFVLDDVPLEARVVKAQLSGYDRLAMDNVAWVVNRASAPGNVLLVTPGDKFLESALSLLPNVNLYKVAPADYKVSTTINGAPLDLTVLDAGVPPEVLDSDIPGNLLVIAPQKSNKLVSVVGSVTDPVPGASAATGDTDSLNASQDPLLRFVDLSSVHIARAIRLQNPPWGRVVLGSDLGPLLVMGQQNERKIAVLAFDLHDSDLPLQTAYPLLMRNLITALLPDPAGGLPLSIDPLAPVSIEAANARVDKIVVEDPDANEHTFAVTGERPRVAFGDTREPGVYYVSQYSGSQLVAQEAFAANLFMRDESMIAPTPKPGLPEGEAGTMGAPGGAAQDPFRREIWPVVALVGLLLLLFEWVYAQRIALRRAITEWQTQRALSRADRT